MPYGMPSKQTEATLASAGLSHATSVGSRSDLDVLTIDVVVAGALDESFEVRDEHARAVVDALAAKLPEEVDGEDWEVVAYVPEVREVYTVRSEQ